MFGRRAARASSNLVSGSQVLARYAWGAWRASAPARRLSATRRL